MFSDMNKLSHKKARILIQSRSRTAAQQRQLDDHLAGCTDCRLYHGMHQHLAANLNVSPVRLQPTPDQLEAIIERSRTRSFGLAISGLNLAGAAALVILLLLGWYLLKFFQTELQIRPMLPQPTVEPTLEAAAAKGQLIETGIPAPALAGSLLSDPDGQTLSIYLPPSYETGSKRYPVVYYLPWHVGEIYYFKTFLDGIYQGADEKEIIVVVISDNTRYSDQPGATFYVNSPLNGRVADYIVEDVVAYVDASYRTVPQAASRGISGQLAGGFGALEIARHHPDTFGAVFAMHPSLLATPDDLEETLFAAPAMRSSMIQLVDTLAIQPRDVAHQALLDMGVNPQAQTVLGYAEAFAADPENHPPYFDYLYTDQETKAPPEVWQQWAGGIGNWEEKVDESRANFIQLEAIGLGFTERGTQPWERRGINHLAGVLTEAGIEHEWYTYSDNLSGILDALLPFFYEHLAFE